jgi:hypothetical protein
MFSFAALATIADAAGLRLKSLGPMTCGSYPVSPSVYRQLMRSKLMYLFLNHLLASRSLRAQRVRTGRAPMMGEKI